MGFDALRGSFKSCFCTFILAFMLTMLCSVCAQAQQSDLEVPELPSVPPPSIKYINPPPALKSQNYIQAYSGWQIISFPFDKVTAVWGLDRMLYSLNNNKYTIIDPVNNPEQIQPGNAYIAYIGTPCNIYYFGKNEKSRKAAKLNKGWNLLAAPSDSAVSLGSVTVTNERKQTIAPADLSQRLTPNSISWIYPTLYAIENGKWKKLPINQSSVLSQGQVFAVCAHEPVYFNWNSVKAENAPKILSAEPKVLTAGETAIIKGENFGAQETGSLSLAGTSITAANIINWSAGFIKFKVPEGSASGSLRVYSGASGSKAVSLNVQNKNGQITAKAASSSAGQAKLTAQAAPASKAKAAPQTKPAAQAKAAPQAKPAAQTKAASQAKPAAKKPNLDLDLLGDIDSSSKSSQSEAQKIAASKPKAHASLDEIQFEQKNIKAGHSAPPAAKKTDSRALSKSSASGSGTGGTLTGMVVSSSGKPLYGAEIILSTGHSAFTDHAGYFAFDSVPADTPIKITAKKAGYNAGHGTISVSPGGSKKIKVALSGGERDRSADAPKYGTFVVHANTMRKGPKDRRVYVYKIEVSEDGNPSRSWKNTWWDDAGDAYQELNCSEAEIGKLYNITITWKGGGRRRQIEKTNQWTERFTSNYQKFSYDHP